MILKLVTDSRLSGVLFDRMLKENLSAADLADRLGIPDWRLTEVLRKGKWETVPKEWFVVIAEYLGTSVFNVYLLADLVEYADFFADPTELSQILAAYGQEIVAARAMSAADWESMPERVQILYASMWAARSGRQLLPKTIG